MLFNLDPSTLIARAIVLCIPTQYPRPGGQLSIHSFRKGEVFASGAGHPALIRIAWRHYNTGWYNLSVWRLLDAVQS
jgi:hypothetical protein